MSLFEVKWGEDTTYYVDVDKDLTYVVGGAVRDICLDRPVMDWDLTTSTSVSTLQEIQTPFCT